MAEDPLGRLVEAVGRSPRYRHVDPALVARLGRRELAARGNLKEAIKATRNTLHQIYGAFFATPPRYDAWLAALSAAREEGPEALRTASLRLMGQHASTRERLPYLHPFYAAIMAELPPVGVVLDLACGLNPLAIPWMGLQPGARYRCCDIDSALVAFLNRYFALAGIEGQAAVRDVPGDPPAAEEADLVLLLKALPTFEAQDRGAVAALLRALRAPYLLVTFPGRTLCGRGKDLASGPAARLTRLARLEGWMMRPLACEAEEPAYLLSRP